MTVSQKKFIAAVFDPGVAPPNGLVDPAGNPAGKRFDVYRNNVVASLSDALEVAFPVVQKLVGDEFFRAMAGVYVRQHQPTTPQLMFYGESFADFLAGFDPVTHLEYLPDVARLEYAQRLAYHAADADPIDPLILQDIAPDTLMESRFTLAPALHLIRSNWPIAAIWRANMDENAPKAENRAEDVLITRPAFDPHIITLPEGAGAFVQALIANAPLSEALKHGTIASGSFDFSEILGILLTESALIHITRRT